MRLYRLPILVLIFAGLPASAQERPSELPPLLPVPPTTVPPPGAPRNSGDEYDPGYFYLPERAPEKSRPNACGPEGRLWFAPALELAWTKSAAVPPLARLGNATGPVVYGADRISSPMQAGFSLTSGIWMNEERTRGIDGTLFYLVGVGSNSLMFSDGNAIHLPTATGSFPLAEPNAGYAGAYQVGLNTRFGFADVNYRNTLLCNSNARIDGLVGYMFSRLRDDYELYGKRLGPGGEIVRFRDDAQAKNDFHGGQIGLVGEYRMDKWYIAGTGKIGFGVVYTTTNLEGKFRVNETVVPIGFYARPDVSGPRSHSHYAVMPVLGLTVGRQLGDHCRVYLGYNFLYLNHVTRGPDVLDPTPAVNAADPQTAVASTNPRRDSTLSDFWVQSFSLGLELRY